jgi:superfamily II DNA or RNA helicase
MVMSEDASGPELRKVPVISSSKRNGARKKFVAPDYRTAYRKAIVDSSHHNRTVVAATKWMLQRKRKVLVLCRLKDHFVRLSEMLQEEGIEHAALWGDTDTADREDAKLSFKHGVVNCILATTIFDEGEDLSGVGGLVLGEGVKAITTTLQRIGRGMRRDTEDVWVVDIVPTSHRTLTEHALQRCVDYEDAGYEVVVLEEWPVRSLRKLPNDLLPFETWDAVAV